MSLPTDAAQMARDGGINTPKLGNNAFTTDKLFQIGQGQFIGRDNTQSGTGNVNATQTYPDISLTSALSAPFNATTAWRSLSAYLNQVKNTNTTATNSESLRLISNSFFGSGQYYGAILGTNGKIYGGGAFAKITVYDPATDQVSTYGPTPSSVLPPYYGGVVAPNGYIYFAPYNATTGVKINPQNNSITSYGVGAFPGANSFVGGVLAPNGKIYFIPAYTATGRIYVVDPANDSITSFGTLIGCFGGCLAPNGYIYAVIEGGISSGNENRSTNFYKIDPSTNTITSFGGIPRSPVFSTSNYLCPILGPNGKIYPITHSQSLVIFIDPDTDTVSVIATVALASTGSGYTSYFGGALASNGKIYVTPCYQTTGYVIDTTNNSVTNQTSRFNLGGSGNYLQAVSHPNGKIYYIPHLSTSMAELNILNNNNFNSNALLSPFYSKT